MVFTQIWYLQKQGLQDQNKGITNCAEFTLQWRNYPIWRYLYTKDNQEISIKPERLTKINIVDPGCFSRIRLFSIPDPESEFFSSRIHEPGSASNNLKQKNGF